MSFYQNFSSGSTSIQCPNGRNSDITLYGENVQCSIDGTTYKGKRSIIVRDGEVIVDGVSQGAHPSNAARRYDVTITGDRIDTVNTAGSATVNGKCASLNSGGSATVTGDVQNLSAGGSASVSGNAGNISAGGSVTVGGRRTNGW